MIPDYSSHILVCPFDARLIERMRSAALVIDVDDPADVLRARQCAERTGNKVHAVRLHMDGDVADLEVREDWQGIPLAISLTGAMGSFRAVYSKLPKLRSLNARFYFSLDHPGICTDVHILASMDMATVLSFGDREPDWDALADLMVYALLGPVPHAPIGPFDYLRDHFDDQGYTSFARVYFDSPARFLHIDHAGRVALTTRDCREGVFALDNLDDIGGIAEMPVYLEAVENWRNTFLSFNACAVCPGWTLCRGQVARIMGDGVACGRFFKEMAECLRQKRYGYSSGRPLWQY